MSPLLVPAQQPRIILGLMTFGPDPASGTRVTDLDEFGRTLDLFQARGYTEVDTARMYADTKQEAFTRAARWSERGLTLATKVMYPSEHGMNAPEKVVESVEASLAALGTGCIDLLYLHAPDRGTPFAATLEAIDKLHKAGKFVQFGISNFTAFEVAEIVMTCRQHGWVRPTVYQAMYNCLTRAIEPELLPACHRYGIDVVVYNPLAGGLLTGSIRSDDISNAVPASGRFSDVNPKLGRLYRGRYFRDATIQALRMIELAVSSHGLGMAETALRWLVHHSALRIPGDSRGRDGIIIGVSKPEQLDQNLSYLERGPLPDGLVQALDKAWEVSKADSANYWHMDVNYGYDTLTALFAPGAK